MFYLASPAVSFWQGYRNSVSQLLRRPVRARPQHRELRALLFTNSVGLLQRPTVIYNKGCETGPPVYSPYPRRLESMTIC